MPNPLRVIMYPWENYAVRESSITRRTIAYLKARPNGLTVKLHGSAMMEAGHPDILHVERGRVWGIELKVGHNKTSAIQEHRLSQWKKAGAIVAVVRSMDDLRRLFEPSASPPPRPLAGAASRTTGGPT